MKFVAKKQTTNYTNYHEEKREKLELFPPDKCAIRGDKMNHELHVYPVGSSCGFTPWGLHGPHTCPAEIFTNGVLKNKQSKRNFGSE